MTNGPHFAQAFEVTVRPALSCDLAGVEAVFEASFPFHQSLRLDSAIASSDSEDTFPQSSVEGETHRIVAVSKDEPEQLIAFLTYQLRADGDVYFTELAATPPNPKDKVRRVGTLLMLFAIEHAMRANCTGLATLNVKSLASAHRPNNQTTDGAVAFYEHLGYEAVEGAVGYTANGESRTLGDIWMMATIGVVHRKLRNQLRLSIQRRH